MSIYVACQCGQAFSAPPQLAGQTVACPMCQRPITVPLQGGAPSQPAVAPYVAPAASPFGVSGAGPMPSDPFAIPAAGSLGPGMQPGAFGPAPKPVQSVPRGDDESPLIMWLSIVGGGLALLVVIGLFIYNATKRPTVPTTATTTPPQTSTPVVNPPAVSPPAAPKPAATPTPAPATPNPATPNPTSPSASPTENPAPATTEASPFTPATEFSGTTSTPAVPATPMPQATNPSHGTVVATGSGKFEVWFPGKPDSMPSPEGAGSTSVLMYASAEKPLVFTVTESQFPAAIGLEQFERQIRQAPAASMLPLGANLSQQRIKFAGYDALEMKKASGPNDPFNGRAVLVIVDKSAFCLAVFGSDGSADGQDAKAFFASFRKKN